MTSALSPVFIPTFREKETRLLKHDGKQNPVICQSSSSVVSCHVTRKGEGNCNVLPAVVTSGLRRDFPMWLSKNLVHLICLVSLLGNATLTAANTGE